MIKATVPSLTQSLMVLDSREAILDLAPLLEELAARCGQDGAMHWLGYLLDSAVLGRRAPRLVLLLRPENGQGDSFCADDLTAAALFFEYEVLGWRTGVVATGDAVGFNSVIAPRGQHARVAAAAARALVDRGASTVLATFEAPRGAEPNQWMADWPKVQWASRNRQVRRVLPLRSTLDETLAQMGKTTRFNLRYYRRRLEKQMACEYVADAGPLLRNADLQAINAGSLNPVPEDEFRRRVTYASTLPGCFVRGLRDGDGRWLSLIGGWRQGETAVLYWQMNCAGLEKHSIGTVMRSFFLEGEIAQGARKLLIFGGTPHSMRHAFGEDAVADLIVQRSSLRGLVTRTAAKILVSRQLLRRSNFVAEALCNPELVWRRSPARTATAVPALLKPLRPQRLA